MLIHQTETAISSHNAIKREGVKPTEKARIMEALRIHGRLSDKAISEATGIRLSSIPDRRGELEKDGLIHSVGTFIDAVTNRPVLNYRISISPELFPEKRKSMQQKKMEVIKLCEEDGGELAKKILKILKG